MALLSTSQDQKTFVRTVIANDNSPYIVPVGHFGIVKSATAPAVDANITINGTTAVLLDADGTSYMSSRLVEPFRISAGDVISATQTAYIVIEEYLL